MLVMLLVFVGSVALPLLAQTSTPQVIPSASTIVAGSGTMTACTVKSPKGGYGAHAFCTGDNAAATTATLYQPDAVSVDSLGNLYIAENASVVRRVDTTGTITTFAGGFATAANGNSTCTNQLVGAVSTTGDGCPANEAFLSGVRGIAIAPVGVTSTLGSAYSINAGDIVLMDYGVSRIRRIDHTTYLISTLAIAGTALSTSGGTLPNGEKIKNMYGAAFDSQGHLYFADQGDNAIQMINFATGKMYAIVNASGTSGCQIGGKTITVTSNTSQTGTASSAEIVSPRAVSIDGAGNLYIASYGNSCPAIFKVAVDPSTGYVDANSTISVVAFGGTSTGAYQPAIGANMGLSGPNGVVAAPNGDLYIGDGADVWFYDHVTEYMHQIVTRGNGLTEGNNGPMAMDTWGNVYLPDSNSSAGGYVRKLALGTDAPGTTDSGSIHVGANDTLAQTSIANPSQFTLTLGSTTGANTGDNTRDYSFTAAAPSSGTYYQQVAITDSSFNVGEIWFTNVNTANTGGYPTLEQATCQSSTSTVIAGSVTAPLSNGSAQSIVLAPGNTGAACAGTEVKHAFNCAATSSPSNGNVNVANCNLATYTPAGGYTAPDSFTYSVTDPTLFNTATIYYDCTLAYFTSNGNSCAGGSNISSITQEALSTAQTSASNGTVWIPGVINVTVTAKPFSMGYGGTPAAIAYQVSPSSINFSTLPTCHTTVTSSSPVGIYNNANTCAGAVASDSYGDSFVFTYVAANATVTQAIPALSVSCPAATFNGQAQFTCTGSATNPNSGAAVGGTWSFSPATETNTGTNTVMGAFTATDPTDYVSGGTASALFVINPATPTLSLNCPAVTFNGQAQMTCTSRATGIGGAAVSGTWSYSPATATNAGTYTVTGTFTSTDPNNNYVSGGTVTASFVINPATPTLSVNCPAVTFNGQAQMSCTGTATGVGGVAVSGTWSYSPATATNAGTYPVTGTFTSTDPNNNYVSGGTVSASFVINQAIPVLSVSCPADTFNGQAQMSCAGTATGAGGAAVSGTWTYSPATATNVGTYPVTGTFIDPKNNYVSGGTASASFVINQATPALSLSCPAVTFNGQAQMSCTGTATGVGGAAASGTWSYSPATQINAGTYPVTATFTSTDPNHNFVSGGTVSASFVVNPTTPTLSITCGTFAYDGTAKSCTATATGVNGPVSGQFSYSPAQSAINAGTYAVTATFTSSDSNYTNMTSATGTLVITAVAPTVSETCGTFAYDRTAKFCTATATGVGGATVAGSFSFAPGSETNAGSYPETGTFTSTDTNYVSGGTASGTLVITAATPALSATCTGGVYNGTAYSCTGSATGVGGATVTGTFAFAPGSETNAGSYPETGTFTSTDTNYVSGGTASGTLVIAPATPAVSVTCGTFTYDGAAKSCTATATGVNGPVNGSFSFSAASAIDAASYPVTATFTSSELNYTNASASGTLIINPATPVLTVACPTGETYNGSAHSCWIGSFTGVGGVSLRSLGNITWSPAQSEIHAGSYSVTATFSGSTDYASITSAVVTFSIGMVDQAAPAVTCPAPLTYNGVAQQCTVTSALSSSLTCTSGTVTNAPGGSVALSCPGDADHNTWSGTGSITISAFTPTVTVICGSFNYDGTPHSCSATVVGLPGANMSGLGTISWSPAQTEVNVGSFPITVTFLSNTLNYASAQGTATLLINGSVTSNCTVTCKEATYNGQAQHCYAVSNPPSVITGLVQYTEAGSYTETATCTPVNANYTPSTGSATLIIDAAAPTVTVSCPSATYDTTSHGCTAQVTGLGGSLLATSAANPAVFAWNPAQSAIDAGSYSVTATFTGSNPDYAVATGSAALNIARIDQAAPTVNCPAALPYDGTAHSCTVISALSSNPTCTSGSVIDVPGGSVALSCPGDTDHNPWTASGFINITAATPTVTVSCGASVPYDGTPHGCTATVTGVPGAATQPSGSFAWTPAQSRTNVAANGSYTIKATFISGNLDYSSGNPASPASGTLTITPIAPTVVETCGNYPYDGTAKSCTATATGLNGAVNGSFSFSPASASAAGSSTPVVATFTSSDPNYTSGGTASGTLTIGAAQQSACNVHCKTVTFDGNSHACYAVSTPTGGFTGLVAYMHAGTYNETATCTPNDPTYAPSSNLVPVTLTINQAVATVTVTCPTATYDTTSHGGCTATATGVNGLNDSNPLSFTWTNATATNAGTTHPVATYVGNPDYVGSGTGNLTIYTSMASIVCTNIQYQLPATTYQPCAVQLATGPFLPLSTNPVTYVTVAGATHSASTYNQQLTVPAPVVGSVVTISAATATSNGNYTVTPIKAASYQKIAVNQIPVVLNCSLPSVTYYGDSGAVNCTVTNTGTQDANVVTYALVKATTQAAALKSTIVKVASVTGYTSQATLTLRGLDTFTVKVSLATGSGYQAQTWTSNSLTVLPRPLTVTLNSPTWTYDVAPTAALKNSLVFTPSGDGLAFSDVLPAVSATTYTATTATTPSTTVTGGLVLTSAIGEYSVMPNITTLTNYTLNQVAGTVTIAPNPAKLTLSALSLSFGTTVTKVGKTATQTLTVTNKTGEALTFTTSGLDSAGIFKATLPANGSCTNLASSLTFSETCAIAVTFAPTSTLAQSDILQITATDANGNALKTLSVPVGGTGH